MCKALAIVVSHAKVDRHNFSVTSAATSSSSLYDLSTDLSISDDQDTQCATDAHQISLFDASASPLNSGTASPFTVLYERLVDSPVVDGPFYSPLDSPLTDVDGFYSPASFIDEYDHLLFGTPLTDVDEFYSPSAASPADAEERFYSPVSTVDGSYCTPLPSPVSSSAIDGPTPYFTPDLHGVAKVFVASSGIGLGILVPASLTPEDEAAEFLFFDTPLSSVTLWDECDQDESWSPADVSILDFFGEPVLSDEKFDKFAHSVEAADVPLPDSPVEHDDLADAAKIPLPDSPVEPMIAADVPLPDSPVAIVDATDVPLPDSPIEVVDAANIPLPDNPVEVVDAATIPLPDSPVEVVDAAYVPLPDSPIKVVDAFDIPRPISPIEQVHAADVSLPDSPVLKVDAADFPLPGSPLEEIEVNESLVAYVTSLPCSSVECIELGDAAFVPLPDSPCEPKDTVGSQFIIPRASPALSVASSESSPVLPFGMPASPSVSCGHEAFDELAQHLADFSLQGDIPSAAATTVGIVEEPVSVEYMLLRASPALSAASSSSSPATKFTVPGSPVSPRPYVAFSYHMEDLVDFDFERALIASPQVDTIIDAFASIGFDGPNGKVLESTVSLKAESQVRAVSC